MVPEKDFESKESKEQRGGYINKFRGVERLFEGYREKIGIEGALTHTSSQGGIHVSHAPEVK